MTAPAVSPALSPILDPDPSSAPDPEPGPGLSPGLSPALSPALSPTLSPALSPGLSPGHGVTMANSDECYFCAQRVYALERISAEGKFFHRSCFKCHKCRIRLRLGGYSFDQATGENCLCDPCPESALVFSST